ncbi:unnamed protein product [Alternaria alternata]
MKTSMIFSILAMALAVSAVLLDERDPTDTNPAPEPAPGGGSGGSGKCNGGQKQACCTGLLGVLTCNIQILGSTCNQEKYCCSTSDPVGAALVNIDAANCVKIL